MIDSSEKHKRQLVFEHQSSRVYEKRSNEFIIWKMNPLVVPVTDVKFFSALLHV